MESKPYVLEHGTEFDKETLIQEFSNIQSELLPKVKLENHFQKDELQLIAGVDLAYWDVNGTTYGTCCIVVIDYHTKEVAETVYSHGVVTTPYIPGFLAFRELPLILEANEKLTKSPDLYMFDGNGYLHDRHMGIATHASFFLNKPTIGVAKSYLKIQGIDFIMPENEMGVYTDIFINNEIYGRTLRTTKNVKPIFVSCGNWIDLDTSTEIVMNCINKESRLPIPVRLADLETHKMRKQLLS
ncbi:endonuclease V [Bacillus sp. REN10]|uniref:endonuclease V n=1 Tax=Bacillus sp. REN10 TaxID=2782541 RepID=UPI001EEF4B95|nr:endonuclease V [Bacillus sp. REN10]